MKLNVINNGINPDEETGTIFTVFYKKGIFKKAEISFHLSYCEAYQRYLLLKNGNPFALALLRQTERGGEQEALHQFRR